MRILIFNTFYYPNMIGGTENSVKILAEALQKEGNEVAVYSVDNEEDKMKIEYINKVKIYRGHAGKYKINVFKNNISGFVEKKNRIIEINNITAIDEIKYVLNDFKPDILHTNNLYGISNIIWKIAKKHYNIPIVHTLRDYWMLCPMKSNETISKIIFNPFMRKRTQYVDIVTAPSQYTLNKFIADGYFKQSKKEAVPNAINLDMEKTTEIINERIKNDNYDGIRFMYVGMLTENKGVRNLLEAFSNIDDEKISLHIYGQGKLKDLIEEYVNKDSRINYYGQLTKEELEKEWIKNDVLIVPSVWEEPFGRVVIEGNQYGLPVIGTNRAGIKEILDNINTGIMYQYDSISELEKSIKYFLNRENIKKYYPNILNNIYKYSVEKQIKYFLEIYKELL